MCSLAYHKSNFACINSQLSGDVLVASDIRIAILGLSEALQLSKEINASDKVSAYRSRANSHLKKARGEAKKEQLQPAEEHLKKAAKAFANMKGMLN